LPPRNSAVLCLQSSPGAVRTFLCFSMVQLPFSCDCAEPLHPHLCLIGRFRVALRCVCATLCPTGVLGPVHLSCPSDQVCGSHSFFPWPSWSHEGWWKGFLGRPYSNSLSYCFMVLAFLSLLYCSGTLLLQPYPKLHLHFRAARLLKKNVSGMSLVIQLLNAAFFGYVFCFQCTLANTTIW
jgi:hypothetical protein